MDEPICGAQRAGMHARGPDNRDMHPQRHTSHRPGGFTLLELMVALAIGAILVALALPSYQNYVMRARRADGMAALNALQQAQERYRAEATAYTTDIGALRGASTASPDGHYRLSVSAAGANSYTLSATANSESPQSRDSLCQTLLLVMINGTVVYRSSNSTSVVDTNNNNRCWAR